MITPPEALDIAPGEYQAAIRSIVTTEPTGTDTVVLFVLTQPDPEDNENPQAGLGGRVARAWFDLDNENPATAAEAKERLQSLLNVAGVKFLEAALGSVVWIRVARVVMRSDPSRYKSAVVDWRPLDDDVPGFVR